MPSRILVICGDQYHPAEDVMACLALAGGPDFEFFQAPSLPAKTINSGFDALVLAKLNVASSTDQTPWADEASDSALHEFVCSGKGLLVIHAGNVGYQSAPRIRSLTGGTFLRHPESCEVHLIPNESPFACGVAPFTVMDEHYFVEVDKGVEVFLTSSSVHGEQPAGWTQSCGEGRTSVLTPGHTGDVLLHNDFMRLLANSLRWTAHG